jgi:ABC-2 type transport system ATP-binding protein
MREGLGNSLLMGNQALIQASGLNRFYGKHHAVNDFNLMLHKGEVLGLLGPNGAGKSTTMQMLTGNISPSSGEIKINGIDLLESPQEAKRSIGYLPEQPPIYRDMTSNEFLSYCAALHDIPKSDRQKAKSIAIDRCGLGNVADKLIANLSKGYQQRVGIAQAILHQPQVVILDEPTVGLDPIQITEIRGLIRELGKDHSVILSTHILPEVQAVCDRVQIIKQGKTVFSDTFEQLEKRQSSSALVVGFDAAIDQAALSTLAGLLKIENLGQHRYKLSFKETPTASALSQLSADKGWKLNELSPQNESLEQIFMNLIHNELPEKSSEANDE